MKFKFLFLVFSIFIIAFALCSFTLKEEVLEKETYYDSVIRFYGEYEFCNFVTMDDVNGSTLSFNNTALYEDGSRAGSWQFNGAVGVIYDTVYNEKVYDVSRGGWTGRMSSRKLNFDSTLSTGNIIFFLYNNYLRDSSCNGKIYRYSNLPIDKWLPTLYFSSLGTWEINGTFIVENMFFNVMRIDSGVISLYNTAQNRGYVIYRQNDGALFNGGLYLGNVVSSHYFDSFFYPTFVGTEAVEVYGSYYFNENVILPESHDSLYYSRAFDNGTYRFFSGSEQYEFSRIFSSLTGPAQEAEIVYTLEDGWYNDSYRFVDFSDGWYMTRSEYDFLISNSVFLGGDREYYYMLGFNEGYASGKEDGYLEGFNAGTNASSPFANFFIDIFTAPVRMLDSLVLFEVPNLGIRTTLWTVLVSCMMLCILTWILKLVAGG